MRNGFRVGFLPAAALLLLLLCGCGGENSAASNSHVPVPEGMQIVRLEDSGAACAIPSELRVLSSGEGHMLLSDPGRTISVSLVWDRESAFPSMEEWLMSRDLGIEGLLSLTEDKAVYDFRTEGGYMLWLVFRRPVAAAMTVRVRTDSPWYDFGETGDLFFAEDGVPTARARLVDEETDAYLSNLADYLLSLEEIAEPEGLREVFQTVNCRELRQAVSRLEATGLHRYIATNERGGIYLQPTERGNDIGVYVGSYQGRERDGEEALWVTIQTDDTKLYSGAWEDDYPQGAFEASSLTTNNGNLLIFDGYCFRGVWNGPVNLRYFSGEMGKLTGSIVCADGIVPVELRPDGDYWNEDSDLRFCFAALYDGLDTYVQLYRDWSDQYFVTRMAYDATLLGDERREGKS